MERIIHVRKITNRIINYKKNHKKKDYKKIDYQDFSFISNSFFFLLSSSLLIIFTTSYMDLFTEVAKINRQHLLYGYNKI